MEPILNWCKNTLVKINQNMGIRDKLLCVTTVLMLAKKRAMLYRTLVSLVQPLQARLRNSIKRILLTLASVAVGASERITYHPPRME